MVKGPTTYPPDAPAKAAGQLRIANFNMENLFGVGMTDDGHTFTQAEIDAKTTRLANAIKVLHKPDILAVEEVASEDSLKEVAAKVGGYQEVWRPSTDARHVAVGFLVRNGIDITDVRQLGVDATTTECGCQDAGVGTKLFERPPLEISVKVKDTRFTLIGNHWASQGHPEPCREAQATFVASAVAGLENFGAQVVVLGDLNDFEDSTAVSTDLVAGTTLRNLWTKAPAQNRYSYSYNGMLQTLDHILVTKGLWKQTLGLEFVHFDNDYYERNETTSPTKVSDHDPPVATLALGWARGGGGARVVKPPENARRRGHAARARLAACPRSSRRSSARCRSRRRALEYAASEHEGQRREADNAPFILHPLEVAHLLQGRDYPDHVIAAGVLHDVLEDTDATEAELAERFGPEVAELVAAVSEPADADGLLRGAQGEAARGRRQRVVGRGGGVRGRQGRQGARVPLGVGRAAARPSAPSTATSWSTTGRAWRCWSASSGRSRWSASCASSSRRWRCCRRAR